MGNSSPQPQLRIVHRDEHVVAVDKPSGLAVHKGWASDPSYALDQTRALVGRRVYPIHPVDLSGAILSRVDLSGAVLDLANLGCFEGTGSIANGVVTPCPESTPERQCTTLQGTVLNKASLQHACLSEASMEGTFLSLSNLDGADMNGVQLQAQTNGNDGKVATLEGAFMRNVNLSGANLTGVTANNANFYSAAGGTADASDVIAPGANFSGAYLAGANFSGSESNLQSTNWTGAMLLGARFDQSDLSTNTSGGDTSGTNTIFDGAYLQGASFESAALTDVNFINTYWDALGAGGSLNLLIPKGNLQFAGYWKNTELPECPQSLRWSSGTPPPMGATNSDNTCPDAGPGPCDGVWDQPVQSIADSTPFKSAVPPDYPQDAQATAANQCSGSFGDPNPYDLCWTITSVPPPSRCVPTQ